MPTSRFDERERTGVDALHRNDARPRIASHKSERSDSQECLQAPRHATAALFPCTLQLMSRARVRTISKWACTTLALLLAAITLASKWWDVTWLWDHPVNGSRSIEVGGGTIEAGWIDVRFGPDSKLEIARSHYWEWGWSLPSSHATRVRWQYGFVYIHNPGYHRFFGMTLLYPTLLTTLAAALFWRTDLRKRAGHCPTCNYNLRGLPATSTCPECGHNSSSRQPHPAHKQLPPPSTLK